MLYILFLYLGFSYIVFNGVVCLIFQTTIHEWIVTELGHFKIWFNKTRDPVNM